MTRMTPELDRLAAARPEAARHAAVLVDDDERRVLLTSIMADEHLHHPRGTHRLRRLIPGIPGALTFRTARPGWRLAVAAGLPAAVAAGALTAVAMTSGPGTPAVRVTTVAELANLAATAAARQPEVRPGQWVYRQTLSNGPGGRHPRFATVERWATADGSKQASYFRGKLVVGRFPPGLVYPYRSLGSLPTDPRALVGALARRSCNGLARLHLPCRRDQNAFIAIGNMFEIYVMPPKITADLYRALAAIPGVTIDKNAVNIAGHRGIGFAYALGHKTIQEIIVNSRTYTYMGSYFGLNLPASKADGQALLRQAFVSGPGIRP